MNRFFIRIIDAIRKTKIRTRVFISLLLISIAPTLLVGYISFQNSSSAIRIKTSAYSIQVLNEAAKNIQSRIKELNAFSDEICYSTMIQNPLQQYLLHKNIDPFQKADIITQLNNYIFSRTSQLADIYDIEIFGQNQSFLYGMGYHTLSEGNVHKYADLAAKSSGVAAWTYESLNNKAMIVSAKQIYSLYNREAIGYMFMAVQEKTFSGLYKNINIGENASLFIIDREGAVVSSANSEIKIGTRFENENLREKIDACVSRGMRTWDQTVAGETNLFAFAHIKNADWVLVGTIPYSYLNKELGDIFWTIFAVCAFVVVLCAILSLLISRSITIPLNKLVAHMKRAEPGELAVQAADETNDEIGYLQTNYNHLITRIGMLIEQNQKEQTEKRELEIQMLQAQITPHFLFNALNSLRWAAKMSQADSVSDGIGALARLLKNTILNISETVSIGEEIKCINDYITIQKIRYGAFFDLKYDIPSEIESCAILKFLLQPIVENAIIHSQESADQQVCIRITGVRTPNGIELKISDNGKGMDRQTLSSVLQSPRKTGRRLSGIGISNVRDRIRLCYGEPYGLEIESACGAGTNVTITIPAQSLIHSE